MRTLSLLFPGLLLFTGRAHAQQTTLQKMADRLMRLEAVSCHYHTDINNNKDNYHGDITGDCFVTFRKDDIRRVATFRLQSDWGSLIYNGHDLFTLNERDSTYAIRNEPADKDFSHLSLFYHSLPTLRNMLPAIERDDSITKTEGDTLIANRPYKTIRLSMYRRSLEYGDSHQPFTIDVTLFYTLVVDPASYLPCEIIERNNIDGDEYVATTYLTAINTQPVPSAEWPWSLPAIQQKYHLAGVPATTPLIAAGMSLPDWVLPAFSTHGDTTIRSGELRGRLLVLDFWIKNCGPCMESWPHLQALQKKYGASMQLLSINAEDSRKDVAFFFIREHPAYKMLYNGKALAAQLGVPAYPTLIIVDSTGKVLYSGVGFDEAKIEGIVRSNLPLAGS
jgi:thiol-disulfide isomerase/thioredoxin